MTISLRPGARRPVSRTSTRKCAAASLTINSCLILSSCLYRDVLSTLVCYEIFNGEVSLNCNLFDLSALTYTRGHKYKLYKQQSSVNVCKYFSVTEFATFGMLYLILCLRCRLQIILEDCLIKLIYISLQCCCDSILCVEHIQWLHALYVQ